MTARILVAGIGNIFLGDDGFGCEVARRLSSQSLPEGVTVRDYGIRGMDLAYELLNAYDAVVFVDALPRGEAPGTLYLLEPEIPNGVATVDTHGMDPVSVLLFARSLGMPPTRTYVVGCEPRIMVNPDNDDQILVQLTPEVMAALNGAVEMVQSLLTQLVEDHEASKEELQAPVSVSG